MGGDDEVEARLLAATLVGRECAQLAVEVADALIDAGFEIRVDSAVEDGRDTPADVRVPLTKQGAGKPARGRGYVQSFTYDM